MISTPKLARVPIYGDLGGEHGGTRAVVAVFTVAPQSSELDKNVT